MSILKMKVLSGKASYGEKLCKQQDRADLNLDEEK